MVYYDHAPQQYANSVDCGVVVLYIIREFFRHKLILRSEAEDGVRIMRTEIVEALVNYSSDEQYPKKKMFQSMRALPYMIT